MERVGLIDEYIYPHYETLHTESRENLTSNNGKGEVQGLNTFGFPLFNMKKYNLIVSLSYGLCRRKIEQHICLYQARL